MVACNGCGNVVFELPTEAARNSLIRCQCGRIVGPYRSLLAFADNDPHTSVNASLQSAQGWWDKK